MAGGLNILVIDDDKVDREAVKRYLKSPGHRDISFREAETGTEALEILQAESFDCIFLDYLLPDMDGVMFLKKVYSAERDLGPAPIVVLTGQGSESIMLDALRRGAQDYLIKDHISSETLNISLVKAKEIFELKQSRKQAEDRLHQIHKLEAVGQLTSGIAHDFNNLLTVIRGNTRLLLKRLNETMPDEARKVEAIEEAARMGAELVSRLMVFTRQQPLHLKETDINQCVADTCELLKRTLGKDIDLQLVYEESPWPVSVDVTQFGNALINLGVNAKDAMASGGRLTIETKNIVLDDSYCAKRPDVSPGPYVMVAVSDTGVGIGMETIKRIFEPFFTTKPMGEGTGLGLSMVYGFINQSGGHISVYSEPGHGTVFRIYLPKVRKEEEDMPELELASLDGKETILIAEDDPEIRNVVALILERLGYRTIQAENGRVALEIIKQEAGKIDLIFTDVIMPGGMSGIDLANEAKTYFSDIKILYTSGYTENAFPNYQLGGGEMLISKPYQKANLAKKIRDVLDDRKS